MSCLLCCFKKQSYRDDDLQTTSSSISDPKQFNILIHGRRSWISKKENVNLVTVRDDMLRALEEQIEEEANTLVPRRQNKKRPSSDDLEKYNKSLGFINRISVYNPIIPNK